MPRDDRPAYNEPGKFAPQALLFELGLSRHRCVVMSASPYQSRLLSTLSTQVTRLKDRFGIQVRSWKVAALWGLQMTLYPVYAAFQGLRWATHQLRQATLQTVNQIQGGDAKPIAVDSAIAAVLSSLHKNSVTSITLHPDRIDADDSTSIGDLTQTSSGDWAGMLAQGTKVQGIVSVLATRHIALVSTQGEVLDILSEPQQRQLKARIIFELALYWRHFRSRQLGSAPGQMTLLSRDRASLVPPLRVVWQLMAWIQAGPIARGFNLFQEDRLTPTLPKGEHYALKGFMPDFRLPPGHPSGLDRRQSTTPRRQTPDWQEVPYLIQAAIGYFFGGSGVAGSRTLSSSTRRARSVAGTPMAAQLMGDRVIHDGVHEDPWLQETDLFGASFLKNLDLENLDDHQLTQRILDAVCPDSVASIAGRATPLSLTGQLRQWAQIVGRRSPLQLGVATIVPSAQSSVAPSKANPRPNTAISPKAISSKAAVRPSRVMRPVTPVQPTQVGRTPQVKPQVKPQPVAVKPSLISFGEPRSRLGSVIQLAVKPSLSHFRSRSHASDRDWIETDSTDLGYEYSWSDRFLSWLDRVIYQAEQKLAERFPWLQRWLKP